ncbi:hypothetical protein SAY87_021214 [Trapa incisa]|uniref:Protein NO VEIN C-terminal domain-containing protein n=1 Tax=Trapa incisa TaxID=236973 RepID=A0AAN7PQU2_9MYRT|nr:hypothetical protein SAY87_021214 [Trapa incisa]
MYGHHGNFRLQGGGGGRRGQPHPPAVNPNFQNQNPTFYHLNTGLQHFHGMLPPQQLPGYLTQNPNFPFQNGNNLPIPNMNFVVRNPNLLAQGLNGPLGQPMEAVSQHQTSLRTPTEAVSQPQTSSQKVGFPIERIERAVVQARSTIHTAGENVSAWKVSQAVVSNLKVDSWNSFGYRMQEIPSLYRLMLTEGKINAYIQCFIGVRRITTLYDLQVAICKNEGVEKFEELELGPLLQHPLVLHYFSVNSDKVFKITSAEIITHLSEFLDAFPDKGVKIEEFMDFIARKRSVPSKENLMVWIQSLGMHIFTIREAKGLEDKPLKKFLKSMKQNTSRKIKGPLLSSQKKLLDERFNSISERIKLFSSVHEDFKGKHTRFLSSSSDDEGSDEDKCKDTTEHKKFLERSDRVSSCPYPSVTEEMERLGLKTEGGTPSSSKSLKTKTGTIQTAQKKNKSKKTKCSLSALSKIGQKGSKRKSAMTNYNKSAPSTMSKRGKKRKAENSLHGCSARKKTPKDNLEDAHPINSGMLVNDHDITTEDDLLLDPNSMRMFIGTWKETCRDMDASKALMRMFQAYNIKSRERMWLTQLFAIYPLIGLLNVAVSSIKNGMWDNIYDALQAIDQCEVDNTVSEANTGYEIIDVHPDEKISMAIRAETSTPLSSATVEDIIGKIVNFFKLNFQSLDKGVSILEQKYIVFKKLCECEAWLVEQFSVKDFKSLGFQGFSAFIEEHMSSFPSQFQELLSMHMCKDAPLDVCMLQHQLIMLVSQSSIMLENEGVLKQMISSLLQKQFPLLHFKVMEKGSLENFLDNVRDYRNSYMSKCLIYSATLSELNGVNSTVNSTVDKMESFASTGMSIPMIIKEAVTRLLEAPMLLDLISLLHWDQVFEPSLGPLMEFLLNEVNSKEMLCLATRDGKVIRIDQSATVDTFLAAALTCSPFLTAVQLVSLISVVGGEKNVPLSLLKCHVCRAFEVIDSNFQGWKASGSMKEKICSASIFFLECLGYVPSEFRSFAAGVLLLGLHSVVKDAPSVVLKECNRLEHHVMLHGLGLSLGIVEWIHDYNSLISDAEIVSFESHVVFKKVEESEHEVNMNHIESAVHDKAFVNTETILGPKGHLMAREFNHMTDDIEKGVPLGVANVDTDASLVIESIRRDEFGLDPALSTSESNMLKKQHARLGRALQCLSRELYSQDSHFLLELIQNADDNIYLEDVEPTLILILQTWGVIVLNNERGFSAANIRALCDVGNSTKKGSTAGYIGQKGIGFKSVFRVTDAPEIHSNGFHIKFDISEGQIGFVLPTLIPTCNIDLYCKLTSTDNILVDHGSWNTCIRLPFKSTLSERNALSNVITKFSDLHPSLLLFLNRLKCIKFRNMLDDSLITMRKEDLGDGLVRVSHGENRTTWLVVSEKLQGNFIRHDVQLTEISLAFTLKESDGGVYVPSLEQQPVFAFLPLRTYGLKFILQGDFTLPSSREEVECDSPWNQWLLSEFPGLFVKAEECFCALPCFKGNRGRAVSAYMSFIPLIGEVHGFFSCLPRMIITKLRMSNCLLLEGENGEWVPPCKALRGWNEEAYKLLPNSLLHNHLGLGFLHKDIFLSDQLARALGVEEYGLKTLIQVICTLSEKKNGVESMGLSWLFDWLSALYSMSVQSSSGQTLENSTNKTSLIRNLQKIAFIPLSDGTFSSLAEGTIWLYTNSLDSGINGEYGSEIFPNIYCKLRIVSPLLFSSIDMHLNDNVMKILQKIGVQQLSAHEIIRVHILPVLSEERNKYQDLNLMVEYICFVMIHLQSSCPSCRIEREHIISELRNNALILTNYGFKRPIQVPIHFSEEYGNPIKVKRLANPEYIRWHEVDNCYLSHPMNASLLNSLKDWRNFFEELGITDFVQAAEVERNYSDISHRIPEIRPMHIHLFGPGSVGRDWESNELVCLLSLLSKGGNPEGCKYLLGILDFHWDKLYSDKVEGCLYLTSSKENPLIFKSSFLSSLCNNRWIVSSMDDELHYPADLFHDCDSVRAVLGPSAPYAVPQVTNVKLLSNIGIKTTVTLNDVFTILDVWERSKTSFMASIAQMSRLYTFIWNEMASSKRSIVDKLKAQKFIFVPVVSVSRHDHTVPGLFCSPDEVYWHDLTGLLDQMNGEFSTILPNHHIPFKTLHDIYSGLRDFFVAECGVLETPCFDGYVKILQQLSSTALPSQAAHAVYKIFVKWNEDLKSGSLAAEDIISLRESLVKPEFTVLPTVEDRWVSLHPSFGVVCWVDNKELEKEFRNVMGIDYLHFGKLSEEDEQMFCTRTSQIMRDLGIPALSDVITREARYEGPLDSSPRSLLINWALPYAQRYICCMHPEKYLEFKQSGVESLKNLSVFVVEKLFYHNLIKHIEKSSKKCHKCSSILQDNTLYSTEESDMHTMFLELSRLFFHGTPNLHMANFLHMITTMAESGSSEDQIEKFVINTQKVSRLPNEEPVWSIAVPTPHLCKGPESLPAMDDSSTLPLASTRVGEQNDLKFNKGTASWPPIGWAAAPDFKYARENGYRTWAASSGEVPHESKEEDGSGVVEAELEGAFPDYIGVSLKMAADSESPSADWILMESNNFQDELAIGSNQSSGGDGPGLKTGTSKFYYREQLNTGAPNPERAILSGKLGEIAAYEYFSNSIGNQRKVKWMNEVKETGLPYDILIEDDKHNREYIEVKSTMSSKKDWFNISLREWQFAMEMGHLFSVAHVLLNNGKAARVTVFRNPFQLCQKGKLQLLVMMPRQSKEIPALPS